MMKHKRKMSSCNNNNNNNQKESNNKKISNDAPCYERKKGSKEITERENFPHRLPQDMWQGANEQPVKGRGMQQQETAAFFHFSSVRLIFFPQSTLLAGNSSSSCHWAATCSGCYCRVSQYFCYFVFAGCLSTFNLFAIPCNNCNFLLSQLPTPAMPCNGRDCYSCGV